MNGEDPLPLVSSDPTGSDSREEPWKEHGPVALDSVPLTDINDTDETFQFRMPTDRKGLGASLKDRGQINPIKVVAGEHGYRIIDGHRRVQEIKRLGWTWTHVRALIYKGMSDREAMAISYESNVRRRNFSFAEKANAMQLALNDGFTRDEIARFFAVKRRTVERHLELPKELREHIDGKVVTMAHGRALKPLIGEVSSKEIGDLVNWIKETGAGEKELRQKMRTEIPIEKRGRKRKFGNLQNGRVEVNRFALGPRSTVEERQAAVGFLREAIREIEGLGHKG